MEYDRWVIRIYLILFIVCTSIKTTHADEKLQSHESFLTSASSDTNSTKKKNSQREEIRAAYKDCSGLEILDEKFQPIYSPTQSFLRKCCPNGQNIGKDEHDNARCMTENYAFHTNIINASFYENCIEDKETYVHLNYSFGYDCDPISSEKNQYTLLYGLHYGDLLYVIQNGSLLRVDEDFNDFDIFNNYCLDMNRGDGNLVAKVCILGPKDVFRAESYLYSTCLWISVPCLLITAFLYLRIKDFRDLHGKSLASLSICFALAYTLLSFAQIYVSVKISYLIQYFLLASLCWLLILCFDICFKTWYLHKKKRTSSSEFEAKMFVRYLSFSFILPMISVCLSMQQQIFGIPLYYIKSHHHFPLDRVDDLFFILPAFILLGLCLVFKLITLYLFSTQNMTGIQISENGTIQPITNYDDYYTLKIMAKNVTLLYTMMTACMIIEFLASYPQSSSDQAAELTPFSLIEIFIPLQGVFIFIISVCLPKPSRIVKRWWVAGGSLEVAASTELQILKPNNNGVTQ